MQPPKPKQSIIATRSYSGPLPVSSEFEKYESTLPGSANRILSMAEQEQQERFNYQKYQQRQLDIATSHIHQERLIGMILGALLCFILIIIGGYLTYKDHDTVGGIAIGSGISSVVGAFVYRITHKDK
jgi:uncharacterized membrane protein